MKPTMVVDSLTLFSDEYNGVSTTLTPTTLKHITQIFESDDCLKSIQVFDQSGFVPPVDPPPLQQQKQQPPATALKSKNNNFYCGGTTTIVSPVKFEPVANLTLKVEKESSESEPEEFDQDDDDYEPVAKKKMQTRNGGVRRSTSIINNNTKSKEPAPGEKRKRKGNMKDDYHHLPPNERQRLLLRRERNKQAAARCRQRREDLTHSLMNEVKMWEGKNVEMEKIIRTLRAQKEELENILQVHSTSCGLVAPRHVVAIKSEPELIEEPFVASSPPPKRHRPASLTIPVTSGLYFDQAEAGPEGVLIETPSTVIPSFDNFLTSTGLTPVVTAISTPLLTNFSVSCAYQQRSKEVPDLNTPGETVSLVSL
jgi:fos-like antigen